MRILYTFYQTNLCAYTYTYIEINRRKLMLLWFKTRLRIGLSCVIFVIRMTHLLMYTYTKFLEVFYFCVPYSSENQG